MKINVQIDFDKQQSKEPNPLHDILKTVAEIFGKKSEVEQPNNVTHFNWVDVNKEKPMANLNIVVSKIRIDNEITNIETVSTMCRVLPDGSEIIEFLDRHLEKIKFVPTHWTYPFYLPKKL